MKKHIFSGVATALVTPFSDGRIDFQALERLIEFQIRGGVDAIVIGGTTGEAATLSDEERYEIFSFAKDRVKGRCKLIFGTGTNDTKIAVKHTEKAEEIGCDGVLLVTPYYNRGTEDGIYSHYERIAAETSLPMILYNVPARTGVNISIKNLQKLAAIDNIVGIKEASDSVDRLMAISEFGDEFKLFAGNDSQFFTVLSLGGAGVISVVSNILPREMSQIWRKFISGEWREALEWQKKLLPIIRALFIETNPAPIKYALSEVGLCEEELRLPLQKIKDESRIILKNELKRMKIL